MFETLNQKIQLIVNLRKLTFPCNLPCREILHTFWWTYSSWENTTINCNQEIILQSSTFICTHSYYVIIELSESRLSGVDFTGTPSHYFNEFTRVLLLSSLLVSREVDIFGCVVGHSVLLCTHQVKYRSSRSLSDLFCWRNWSES